MEDKKKESGWPISPNGVRIGMSFLGIILTICGLVTVICSAAFARENDLKHIIRLSGLTWVEPHLSGLRISYSFLGVFCMLVGMAAFAMIKYRDRNFFVIVGYQIALVILLILTLVAAMYPLNLKSMTSKSAADAFC